MKKLFLLIPLIILFTACSGDFKPKLEDYSCKAKAEINNCNFECRFNFKKIGYFTAEVEDDGGLCVLHYDASTENIKISFDNAEYKYAPSNLPDMCLAKVVQSAFVTMGSEKLTSGRNKLSCSSGDFEAIFTENGNLEKLNFKSADIVINFSCFS